VIKKAVSKIREIIQHNPCDQTRALLFPVIVSIGHGGKAFRRLSVLNKYGVIP
jgi:hypothetical protein